jgi:hypothetical protein
MNSLVPDGTTDNLNKLPEEAKKLGLTADDLSMDLSNPGTENTTLGTIQSLSFDDNKDDDADTATSALSFTLNKDDLSFDTTLTDAII